MSGIKGYKRTSMCAELNAGNAGDIVCLMGWAAKIRLLGGLSFIALRDRSGIIQIAVGDDAPQTMKDIVSSIRSEYVLAVRGEVILRQPKDANPKMETGTIEIRATEIAIISKSDPLPLQVEDDSNVNESLKLKYRYLDLRRSEMQRNLMLRHDVARIARDYFYGQGFLEIETPMLTKSTPEGARDYLVPSRVHPGKFYALPQSPQLFKQILMLSGYDRYIQIARCFRDEDLRADRQPEFTQIDLEMSFVDVEDVLDVNEGFLQKLFREIHHMEIALPLPRLTYAQAMERYGSDKPDIRFAMEIRDIAKLVADTEFKPFLDCQAPGSGVRAIKALGCGAKMSRKDIDAFAESAKESGAKGLAWIIFEETGTRSSLSKFLNENQMASIRSEMSAGPGDIVFIVSDTDEIALPALGDLRLQIAKKYDMIEKNSFAFLWVTDFPLLEWNEEDRRFYAKHHPFTSPMDEDVGLLESDPGRVRAKAYDMVLNGTEIGGGSIRIHDSALQSLMFKTLGFTEEDAWSRFGFLLEAFKYGTPPHGGMAYGLDRLAMLLAFRTSIRDVIAFPKIQNASCLMTNSPDVVGEKQLLELHIAVAPEKEKEP